MSRARLVPVTVLVGGALVMLGAWLPWLTLFAGLQRHSGLSGLNGRVLLVGGALAVPLAVALRRPSSAAARATVALGATLAALSGWVLVGLVELVRRGAASPMLLAGYGPGVFVALAGALLVLVAPLPWSRTRAPIGSLADPARQEH